MSVIYTIIKDRKPLNMIIVNILGLLNSPEKLDRRFNYIHNIVDLCPAEGIKTNHFLVNNHSVQEIIIITDN